MHFASLLCHRMLLLAVSLDGVMRNTRRKTGSDSSKVSPPERIFRRVKWAKIQVGQMFFARFLAQFKIGIDGYDGSNAIQARVVYAQYHRYRFRFGNVIEIKFCCF